MSHSPATPSKTSKHAIEPSPDSSMISVQKPTSASKMTQAPLNEPSPASTYGDTIGSSAPDTPLTPEEISKKNGTYCFFSLPLSAPSFFDAVHAMSRILIQVYTPFWLAVSPHSWDGTTHQRNDHRYCFLHSLLTISDLKRNNQLIILHLQ